jgi:molybdate transport system regulatory protein
VAGLIEVAFRIDVLRNRTPFLRPANVELLREIDRRGSLRIAAKRLRISYQHAWDLVKEINRVAAEPVVVLHRGGAGGGGAALSAHGRRLIEEFEQIEEAVARFAKKLNAEINF